MLSINGSQIESEGFEEIHFFFFFFCELHLTSTCESILFLLHLFSMCSSSEDHIHLNDPCGIYVSVV